MNEPDKYFLNMLITRILYQLERQGLMKVQGKTVDEIQANIHKAREIGTEMLLNGRERPSR